MTLIFGEEKVIKQIDYGECPDTIFNPDYFWEYYYELLVEGIGVIYKFNIEDPQGPQKILRGCIVDGDTFGIITSTVKENDFLPDAFIISQNYPNPFNPSTTIEFSIPLEAHVRFSIYDLLGREVTALINERRNAGTYKVVFDGYNLSSGVYLARLEVNGNIKTIKMLLTK